MEQSQQDRSALFAGEGSATLALVIYLAIAILVMIADRRGGYLEQLHGTIARLSAPLYTLAELPWLVGQALRDGVIDRRQLNADNRELQQELLRGELRIHELERDLREQQRLLGGLELAKRERLAGLPARVVDVDLDPYRHRVMLDLGKSDGIGVGAALIDGGGVVGQVISVQGHFAHAMLISDPGHGLPVVVIRSGLRTLLSGTGERDRLVIASMPLSADLNVGDVLLSSGIGGRFPAGLPVAVVDAVERSPGSAYGRASAKPLAGLDRVREVLVVTASEEVGPRPALDSFKPASPYALAPQGPASTVDAESVESEQ